MIVHANNPSTCWTEVSGSKVQGHGSRELGQQLRVRMTFPDNRGKCPAQMSGSSPITIAPGDLMPLASPDFHRHVHASPPHIYVV